jgi:hypothetical protein
MFGKVAIPTKRFKIIKVKGYIRISVRRSIEIYLVMYNLCSVYLAKLGTSLTYRMK